jgi:DNA-directed RNA polymerase subunit M/transcription elongation factor TFIIS
MADISKVVKSVKTAKTKMAKPKKLDKVQKCRQRMASYSEEQRERLDEILCRFMFGAGDASVRRR